MILRSRRQFLGLALGLKVGIGTLVGAGHRPVRAADTGNALAQLRHFLKNVQGAKGEFTQTSLGKIPRAGQATREMSGRFAFKRPGRFRWEVLRPYEQTLVADGEKLWFYDVDLNQVTVKPWETAVDTTPAAVLFGNVEPEKAFVLDELPRDDEGLAWLEAVPRKKDAGFERLAMGFSENLPVLIDVLDGFGQTTRLRFSKIERASNAADATFRFVPPKGADVVPDGG